MRLLLDESVPARLRDSLQPHNVSTVVEMGWGGLANSALLSAAAAHFDALVTVDRNIVHQQNLNTLPLSVVVLAAKSNSLNGLLPLVPEVRQVLDRLAPNTLVTVG